MTNLHNVVDELLRLGDFLFEDRSLDAAFHALAAAAGAASSFFNIEALSECRRIAVSRLAADALSPPDILRDETSSPRINRPDYAALICRIEDYYLPLARLGVKAAGLKS